MVKPESTQTEDNRYKLYYCSRCEHFHTESQYSEFSNHKTWVDLALNSLNNLYKSPKQRVSDGKN